MKTLAKQKLEIPHLVTSKFNDVIILYGWHHVVKSQSSNSKKTGSKQQQHTIIILETKSITILVPGPVFCLWQSGCMQKNISYFIKGATHVLKDPYKLNQIDWSLQFLNARFGVN